MQRGEQEEKEDFKALRAKFHAKAEMSDTGGGPRPQQPPVVGRLGPSVFPSPLNEALKLRIAPAPRLPRTSLGAQDPAPTPPAGVFPRPPPGRGPFAPEPKPPAEPPAPEGCPVRSRAEELRQNFMVKQQATQEEPREPPRAPVALTPPLRSQRSASEIAAPLRRPLPSEKTLGPRPVKPKRPPTVSLEAFRKTGLSCPSPARAPYGRSNGGNPPLPGLASSTTPPRIPLKLSASVHQQSIPLQEEEQDTYDDVDILPPPPPPPPKFREDSLNDHSSIQGDEDSDGSEVYEQVDNHESTPRHHNDKKRQKELKRQQELDRKEMKEKQKKESEIRKKFKLTGPIEVLHAAKARHDWRGTKNDLCVRQGDSLEIIRVKNNPEGKWLARTPKGAYGYISNTCVDVDYEEVKRKIRSQTLESSPGPTAIDEDFYDDVGSSDQMNSSRNTDNEDVYDDVQAIPEDFPPPPPEVSFSLDPKKSKKQEKEEKEFRKKFKFEGPIEVICQMMVNPNASLKKGGGKDLTLVCGEILDVIQLVNDKKALCRNSQGKYGYVPRIALLQAEGDIYDDIENSSDIYDNE
ncbi:FYN-binding protein 1 isoform X1 [Lepisosteus oculatus]|uniref:FYN-binding protein 1 isoform X1 n=1 Tax=Lepisosteus oculatus TaxID=7918 RepID=UPI00371C7776